MVTSSPLTYPELRKNIKPGTDMDNTVILAIKARVDKMSPKEKQCSVIIGSLQLKANLCYNIKEGKIYGLQEISGIQYIEPATMGLVLMIRGIFFDWKQLISYILVSQDKYQDMIQNWINSILKKLLGIGLNIRTIISSLKDDLVNSIIVSKLVTEEAPFIFVDNKKIYHVYDGRDLIISARDCLIEYDFHFENKVGKYDDIVKFYNVDRQQRIPHAHKLTESHVYPTNVEKQDIKYAVELMSKTVANGLWNYMTFKMIEDVNVGTVELITKISDLWDILNVFKENCDDDDRIIMNEKEIHDHLKQMLLFFQNLKIVNRVNGLDETFKSKLVKAILLTVKSILLLFEDLEVEGYSVVLTKNWLRKPLDDYFAKMFQSCGSKTRKRKKFTTLLFTTSFKKFFFIYLVNFMNRSNTKDQVAIFLEHFNLLKEQVAEEDQKLISEPLNQTSVSTATVESSSCTPSSSSTHITGKKAYELFDTLKKKNYIYICGFLLSKAKIVHQCNLFMQYLYCHKYSHFTNDFSRFTEYMSKACDDRTSLFPLEAPSNDFIRFVEEMDTTFVKMFTENHMCKNICDSIFEHIETIQFQLPCQCFPRCYIVMNFIRLKISHLIRLNNTLFKENKRNQKCLTVPKLLENNTKSTF